MLSHSTETSSEAWRVVLTSRDGDVPHAPLIVVLRGMSREGSTWVFSSNYGSFTSNFSVTCFLHVDNFLQIIVYLSVVKLEVLPIVDIMHTFPSFLCPFFLSKRKLRICASNRSAGSNSPRIVSNLLQHYQGCTVFDVWDDLAQQGLDNANRNSCEKHNRRSIWDDLDHYACRLCVVTDTIIRSKRPQGYTQIPAEHDTVQITRSTGRFLRRENLLRREHEFR